MPKRKREKNSDVSMEYLNKRIMRLERKLRRNRKRRRNNSESSSSDLQSAKFQQERDSITITNDMTSHEYLPGDPNWSNEALSSNAAQGVDTLAAVESAVTAASSAPVLPSPPAIVYPASQSTHQVHECQQSTSTAALKITDMPTLIHEDITELDKEMLDILGEDPSVAKEYGKEIQKDLAIRLNHIVTTGLSKENRKEIKDKYLVPSNCKLIKAPSLNPDISASLIDSQVKRDKGIEYKQTLTACALSSLAEAITQLLSSENRNPELLKLLMDTGRILGDIQHFDSMTRRAFILSTLKRELKDQLEKTNIDELLFSKDLSETLKTAKTISKSGAELRLASANKMPLQKQPIKAQNKSLNWRAPPQYRKAPPPGNTRSTKVAPPTSKQATTARHANASSRSSRQQNPRQRR